MRNMLCRLLLCSYLLIFIFYSFNIQYLLHFLQQLFKVAKGKKAERMFLEVRPSNTRAVGLYEKLGYAQIGKRKNYYPAGDGREDALVYSIDLNPTVI